MLFIMKCKKFAIYAALSLLLVFSLVGTYNASGLAAEMQEARHELVRNKDGKWQDSGRYTYNNKLEYAIAEVGVQGGGGMLLLIVAEAIGLVVCSIGAYKNYAPVKEYLADSTKLAEAKRQEQLKQLGAQQGEPTKQAEQEKQ